MTTIKSPAPAEVFRKTPASPSPRDVPDDRTEEQLVAVLEEVLRQMRDLAELSPEASA